MIYTVSNIYDLLTVISLHLMIQKHELSLDTTIPNLERTLIDLHNLKQIKIKNLKPTYNIEDVKDVQKNLLRKNKTSITVYNIQTKKYITIPFFPNLYVKDAIFTATSASHDFDEFSLKVLEMYGSKLE